MERLRRVSQLWSWLPAFRAVGETQHLPTAAKHLRVTAPALSRAVRLLEQNVGQPLFRRTGRRIELNDAGEKLLAAVRHAMRLVHEGVLLVRSEQLEGPVYVCSAGAITTAHVIPALEELRKEHPELVPTVQTVQPLEAVPMVLRGATDVIFHSTTLVHPGLITVHLGDESCGIYCGPGHPLFRKRKVDLDALLEHAFVAPPPDVYGDTLEGWPTEIPRRVGMHVDQMRVGCEVCASGLLLAVLPDVIAKSFGRASLRRLPVDLIRPTHLFATYRPPLELESRADAVVAAVQQHLAREVSPRKVSPSS